MTNKGFRLTTQMRILVLNVLGIIFVAVGVLALFPIGYLPVSAVYYTVSNPYIGIGAIIIGIIILTAALIASIQNIKKTCPDQTAKRSLPLA
jgi:hypothetical protein